MTYEQLEKKVKSIVIHLECDSDFDGHISKDHQFKTLTLFHNKDGYKLAVRWADNLNASGLYKSTLAGAFQSMIDSLKEEYPEKHGWTFNV